MRLLVEVTRRPDGRSEGCIRAENADLSMPFSGVLELLKVLEDLLDDDVLAHSPPPIARPEGTS